jgi:hypothetical protein
MKRTVLLALSGFTVLALFATLRADDTKSDTRLVGTWKMVSAKFGGQESELPKETTTYKHITPTQFIWVSIDPQSKQITRAAGGKYTLKGDTYEETPSYGMSGDFATVRDQTHTFTCKIEGNRWFHTGKLAGGLTIEEVWEREEAK